MSGSLPSRSLRRLISGLLTAAITGATACTFLFASSSTANAAEETASPSGITRVAAGMGRSAVVVDAGQAYSWGTNKEGALGDGGSENRSTPVPVAQGEIPEGVSIVQVSAGYSHTLALGSDGHAYSWGNNHYGELGNGKSALASFETAPVAVKQGALPEGVSFTQVSAGFFHSIALGSDGQIYTWGYNRYGQLGNGESGTASSVNRNTPVAVAQGSVPANTKFSQVDAGGDHNLALGNDGTVYSWGRNLRGQLGDNTPVTWNSMRATLAPIEHGEAPAGTKYVYVAAGGDRSFAVAADGATFGWGVNSSGELGLGNDFADRASATKVSRGEIPDGVSLQQISVGFFHNVAVGSDGNAYSWGWNGTGQLGDGNSGDDFDSYTPVRVTQGGIPEGAIITDVSAAREHSLARTSDGRIFSWGSNYSLELGDGSGQSSAAPVQVWPIETVEPEPTEVAPAVTEQPASVTVTAGEDVVFSAAANGTPAPSVQWQSLASNNTEWADIPEATEAQLTVTNVTEEITDTQYRAVFTNTAGEAITNAVTLTVTPSTLEVAPTVTEQPAPVTMAAGEDAVFSAAASGTPDPSVQWQTLTSDNTEWVNVPDAIEAQLTVTNVTEEANNTQYRAVFTNTAGEAITNAVTLTVAPAPEPEATVPETPGAPIASATDSTVSATWSAPADGGSPITGYTVTLTGSTGDPLVQEVGSDATSTTFANLPAATYTVTVVAVNAKGSSDASPASNEVTIESTSGETPDEKNSGEGEPGDKVTPLPSSELTDANRGGVNVPESAVQGSQITVSVGQAHAGEQVRVWVHSTSSLLGTVTLDAKGSATVTIPSDMPLGDHKIVVQALDGSLIGWDSINIGTASQVGPNGEPLANTGADGGMVFPLTAAAGVLLLLGAVILVSTAKHRRETSRSIGR